MFDNNNQTLDIYRSFVYLHYEINPYLLTSGTDAYERGVSTVTPLADRTVLQPSTWEYLLGPDMLVSPIVENVTRVHVSFPSGANWVDWFNPSAVYQGGSSERLDYPLETYPVFLRQGSMIPLQVNNSLHGHGNARSEPYTTLLISQPRIPQSEVAAVVRSWYSDTQEVFYSIEERPDGAVLHVSATEHSRKLLFLVQTTHPLLRADRVKFALDVRSSASLALFATHEQFDACETRCVFVGRNEVKVKMHTSEGGGSYQVHFA